MQHTARSAEFMEKEGRAKAISTCKLLGLDGIVAIGGKQGIGISFSIFRCACWGYPKPRTGRKASGRTRLTAWLFRSLWSLIPAHPRRKYETRPAPVKDAPGTAQIPHGRSAG